MWSPTHVQVTVQRAKGLLIKGKNGTNNCFVTIGLGKEKYQTSIKEKASVAVEWHEECELTIPDQGNKAELILTCLHRNSLGLDEFLGQIILPLNEMDVYERPRSKWYKLESKPGKEKKKERGEIEIRISFVVKSGSLNDLNKKDKRGSLSQITSSVGGSLLSIGTGEKRKKLKKFAKSLGSKMHIGSKSKHDIKDNDSDFSGSLSSISTSISTKQNYGQTKDDADPGVISEDEDEFVFDNLSHKSSGSSLNIIKTEHKLSSPSSSIKKDDIDTRSKTLSLSPSSIKDSRIMNDEWSAKLYGKNLDIDNRDSLKRRSWGSSGLIISQKDENKKKIDPEKQSIAETESDIEQNISKNNNNNNNNNNNITTISSSYQSPILKSKEINSSIKKNITNNNHNQSTLNLSSIQPLGLSRSNTTGNLLESLNKESEKERGDKNERKRFNKLKYFRKDKQENLDSERIIVGHENHILKTGDKVEISKEILKKYDGKSKEEIILIAHGFENEVCCQRQRIKELEDYLDNLLLRVMETHPKILQNPYDRNTTTKSG